jgi:hypothetical protein
MFLLQNDFLHSFFILFHFDFILTGCPLQWPVLLLHLLRQRHHY